MNAVLETSKYHIHESQKKKKKKKNKKTERMNKLIHRNIIILAIKYGIAFLGWEGGEEHQYKGSNSLNCDLNGNHNESFHIR